MFVYTDCEYHAVFMLPQQTSDRRVCVYDPTSQMVEVPLGADERSRYRSNNVRNCYREMIAVEGLSV